MTPRSSDENSDMPDWDSIIPTHSEDQVPGAVARLLKDKDFIDYAMAEMKKGEPWHKRIAIKYAGRVLAPIYGRRNLKDQESVHRYLKKLADEKVGDALTQIRIDDQSLERLTDGQPGFVISSHMTYFFEALGLGVLCYDKQKPIPKFAIGDNLVPEPWHVDVAKLSNCLIVPRGDEDKRVALASANALSRIMWDYINDGHKVWIAQSKGRSKDGRVITEDGVANVITRHPNSIDELTTVRVYPLIVSYETLPCDKFIALQRLYGLLGLKYNKPKNEDKLGMTIDLEEDKGRIEFAVDQPIEYTTSKSDRVNKRQIVRDIEEGMLRKYANRKFASHQAGARLLIEALPEGKQRYERLDTMLKDTPVSAIAKLTQRFGRFEEEVDERRRHDKSLDAKLREMEGTQEGQQALETFKQQAFYEVYGRRTLDHYDYFQRAAA